MHLFERARPTQMWAEIFSLLSSLCRNENRGGEKLLGRENGSVSRHRTQYYTHLGSTHFCTHTFRRSHYKIFLLNCFIRSDSSNAISCKIAYILHQLTEMHWCLQLDLTSTHILNRTHVKVRECMCPVPSFLPSPLNLV